MKRILLSAAAIAAVLVISGCNMMAGSGVVVDYEFFEKDFTGIEVSNTCDLTVEKGEQFSTVISCDDNLSQYLDVVKTGNVLRIGLKPYTNYNNITFKAKVTMPSLNSLSVSGASAAGISGFDSGTGLNLAISGASDCTVKLDSAGNITADVSGASKLDLDAVLVSGDLSLVCSGASRADLRDSTVDDATIEISGASDAWITAAGTVSGNVSGASSLYYGGSTNISALNVDLTSDLIRF